MPSFKQPTFQERTALAAKAKQAALEKLRAKPPVDAAVLAERRAAAEARAATQLKLREEKQAARLAAKAEKAALDAAAAAAAPIAMTEEERKRIRDEKYAARKNRVGRR